MTREAFQRWIRANLKHQVFMEVEEKCKLLQSLLDRREQLSAHLLQLCRSVSFRLCAVNSGGVNSNDAAVKYWIALRDLIFFSPRLDSFS